MERRLPLHIKILVATLLAMMVIAVTNTFAARNDDMFITEKEFSEFSEDVELGLYQLDTLKKQQLSPSASVIEDIKATSRDMKYKYLNYKSDNKLATEIAMLLSSGFASTEKAIIGYNNTAEASRNYQSAKENFNDVLRALNKHLISQRK